MNSLDLEAKAKVFAALADPTRLRIVELVAEETEVCGTDLAKRAGISIALLSHHWKVLAEAGVVIREKRGRQQFCRVDQNVLSAAFTGIWPSSRLQSQIS